MLDSELAVEFPQADFSLTANSRRSYHPNNKQVLTVAFPSDLILP